MDALVIYDIATPDSDAQNRLRRVAKVCEGFGVRVQKSVFECRISDEDMVFLETALRDVIDPDSDSVVVYRIHGKFERIRLEIGKPPGFTADGPWVL